MLRRNKKLLILPKKTIVEVKGPFLDEYVLISFATFPGIDVCAVGGVGRRRFVIKILNGRCKTRLNGWKWKRAGSIRTILVCLVYFLLVLSIFPLHKSRREE